MKADKKIVDELSSFSWKDLNSLIKEGIFQATKAPLSKQTYEFIAKSKNYETVVQLVFTVLQKGDLNNATIERAAEIADEMQKLSRKMLEQEG